MIGGCGHIRKKNCAFILPLDMCQESDERASDKKELKRKVRGKIWIL